MTILAGVAAFLGSGALPAAASTTAPSLTWTQLSPATSPPARYSASMAYDPATGDMVLFGGIGNSGSLLSDTWTWDGTTCTQSLPAASPSARYSASMAYDPATGDMVLFGGQGNSGGPLSDTWTWDGTTWTQSHPATSPPARAAASMAYDPATGNMVLFGGFGGFGSSSTLSDTWTWDGTTWTQSNPATSPPARVNASMAYDPATGNMVLFGGIGSSGNTLSDTWSWTIATVPGAPTESAPSAVGNGTVTLNWSAPASDGGSPITGYHVYDSTSQGGENTSGTPACTGGAAATTCTVNGLGNGTTYYFVVTALNAAGQSVASNEESATPVTVPSAPGRLTARAGDAKLTLSCRGSRFLGDE